jgi:hypothetical protein
MTGPMLHTVDVDSDARTIFEAITTKAGRGRILDVRLRHRGRRRVDRPLRVRGSARGSADAYRGTDPG